ncbi:FHA domain-containing serine/threonine-protein kinase [Neorhodopirellula pilleata]|uniref:Serine/threonine-protein kinase PK-1 n=1 Tax=Neorhodopirellula pilleata TaxID=2714738 RepID=A0A5C5ZLH4_9BACT|nr:FHA domain-containing serine/threonine-protein kinase [Neorhodopirellula pilleata]TWT88025.1 Serine/threonine-protein kinase PK-1 [Neorhodopirellula pilleata]
MTPIRYVLEITDGPDAGRRFEVDSSEPFVIGRGSDSHTQIRDPKLSRIHCELNAQNGSLTLADRGGAGGVRLDGRPIQQSAQVSTDGVIEVGDSRIKLTLLDGLDAPTVGPQVALAPVQSSVKQDTAKPDASKPEPKSVRDLVGHTLHRYRIDKLVTSSSNSVVFKAFDTRRERVVALKVLQPAMASTDVQRERFIRAMRTVLPIRHDNIVRLYKAGKQGPYCWAAMQWVDGISVRELIDHVGVSGMLDWKEVWRLAVDIALALQEAEKHRIIHRNVTPSNILRRQNDMRYLLTDLIFTRALEETNAAQLTRPGDVIGDLCFLAPERLLDATQCDGRSDQYSLGATLYALLTGHPPHEAFGVVDLIDKFRRDDPKPPHECQLGLDERFSDVVMKLLRKTPDQRFLSPSDLLRQLQRVGQLAGIEAGLGVWQ